MTALTGADSPGSTLDSTSPRIRQLRRDFLSHRPSEEAYAAQLRLAEKEAEELLARDRSAQAYFLLATVEYYRGLRPGEWGDPQAGEPHFNQAEEYLKRIPQWEEISEVHRFLAEIMGQKMLLGGIGALVMNYFPLEGHLKTALELDPDNRKAAILKNFKLVHAPPLLGRNYRRAEKLFNRWAEEALEPGGDPWEAHVCYHTLGFLEAKRRRPEEARDYYLKAMAIYPGNYYVSTQLLELGYDPQDEGYPLPPPLKRESS